MVENGGQVAAFFGTYYFSLDPKGRVIVPAPFREIISSNYSPRLYIVNDIFDKCLHIYPQEEWVKLEEKVRNLPKMDKHVKLYMRRVMGSAQEVEIDKQGRVLISAAQRQDAALNSDIVIVGQLEKIDLWDRKEWDSVNDISKFDQNETTEKLAALGI